MINDGESSRRYCLLQAANDCEYVKKVYGSYYNVYVQTFAEEGETWDSFRVHKDHFPDFHNLHKYDAFVITGSPSDAYANDYWLLKLCFMLQTLDATDKKILGICFGHQAWLWVEGLVNRTQGGTLGLDSAFHERSRSMLWLSIVEVHQDEVYEVIASSDKTRVEMFAIADHILGIHGHPEYARDILFNLIDLLMNMNGIEKGYAEDLNCRFELSEADKEHWRKICGNFLRGK